MNSVDKVLAAIEQFDMFSKSEKILIGLSGGADSVCLTDILYNLGYDIVCCHLNHGMRDTAVRDAEFCKGFCNARNIPFYSECVERGTLKSENDARIARYEFFDKIMAQCGIYKLATAHNKNDSAETVLLHILRGASTDGFSGINPKNENIVRPLIYLTKLEIIEYCKENGLEYMTDETNFSNDYARNRLRNEIIPELAEKFNPSIIDTIADNALITLEDSLYLKRVSNAEYERIKTKNGIAITDLSMLDRALQTRVVQILWQKSCGEMINLSHKYIDEIIKLVNRNENKSLDLPNSFTAEIEYGYLNIKKKSEKAEYSYRVTFDEWIKIPEAKMSVMISSEQSEDSIYIDSEDVVLRNRRAGDRFYPVGMDGTKKISDYFSDMKMKKEERNVLPLLVVDGKIASVITKRMDRRFKTGKRAFSVKVKREN